MQERRQTMDPESRSKFTILTESISELRNTLVEHVAYNKGLKLDKRLEKIESNFIEFDKTKVSYKDLYKAAILITGFLGTAYAISQAVMK